MIEHLAGRGGMSSVYRAIDLVRGTPVALKLLRHIASQPADWDRFSREAQVLSVLHHPSVVSYVAHGRSTHGEPYLAMEWLEGETLASRLLRGTLALSDCLTLLRVVAAALAAVHQSGVVHRDLKPSNLLLRDGRVESVTLLDFGIARHQMSRERPTRTGAILGTPGYLAPEQARGERGVGPRADLFSLGCVLYECVCGKPPFIAEYPVAVLAKILFEEPPPLSGVCPGLPAEFVDLLRRMLAKSADARPVDAEEVLSSAVALAAGSYLEDHPKVQPPVPAAELETSEQRLLSVVVAVPLSATEQPLTAVPATGVLHAESIGPDGPLHRVLLECCAQVEWLGSGLLIATLIQPSGATDQAMLAARCALRIRRHWPAARVALATGRGVLDPLGQLPIGEVIDRAMQLVFADPTAGAADAKGAVWLDQISAGLLDSRFIVVRGERTALLHDEQERNLVEPIHRLLGRQTPCVGREHELTMLEVIHATCIEQAAARAVLVTAPSGMGKSRLRDEFLRRLRARAAGTAILIADGEPHSGRSPYRLLSQALHIRCGLNAAHSVADKRERLLGYLQQVLPAVTLQRTAEFLGELCRIPFSDEHSAPLRAARQDVKLMSAQIELAFISWLRAECARAPLLFILEDLHWGDPRSVQLIAAALDALTDRPCLVLALARPEVHECFPYLWSQHVQEIRLHGLTRKACEQLIHATCESRPDGQAVARMIEQAEGNALYLEQLIYAFAMGDVEQVPGSLMAMLQARITRLPLPVRRVLEAASVMGATFWCRGLAEILAEELPAGAIERHMTTLVHAELIERQDRSRFADDIEWRFRHDLMQVAAYSLMTESTQKRSHLLAARHLLQANRYDPAMVAGHYRRGDALAAAIPFYTQAAQHLVDSSDSASALEIIESGLTCGPENTQLGTLRALQQRALFAQGDLVTGVASGWEALALLPPGSKPWCTAIGEQVMVSMMGSPERLLELMASVVRIEPEQEALGQYAKALANIVIFAAAVGVREAGQRCQEHLDKLVSAQNLDELALSWAAQARSYYHRFLGADPWVVYTSNQQAVAAQQLMNNDRDLVFKLGELATAQTELGAYKDATATLQAAVALADKVSEPFSSVLVREAQLINLVFQADTDRQAEAVALAESVLPQLGGNYLYEGTTRCLLGEAQTRLGRLDEAERELRLGMKLLHTVPSQQLLGFIYLVGVLLKKGDSAAAEQLARQGLQALDALGNTGDYVVRLQLAAAEAFHAAGNDGTARRTLQEALCQLHRRAERIPELPVRQRFLHKVSYNSRVLALAARWFGGGSSAA